MRVRCSICLNGRRACNPSSRRVPWLILLPMELGIVLRVLPGILHRETQDSSPHNGPDSAPANCLIGALLLSRKRKAHKGGSHAAPSVMG